MKFDCNSCGACCKTVGMMVEAARKSVLNENTKALTKEVAEFPYKTEKGRCEKLGEDNRCTVYDSRPDICRIDKTRKKHFPGTTKKEYYSGVAAMCEVHRDMVKNVL